MISTATALELLGPDFRYPTRVLGATPDGGAVHGDVYLLGSYDPTLTVGDLDQLAAAIAARGITRSTATSWSAPIRPATACTARSSRSTSAAASPAPRRSWRCPPAWT